MYKQQLPFPTHFESKESVIPSSYSTQNIQFQNLHPISLWAAVLNFFIFSSEPGNRAYKPYLHFVIVDTHPSQATSANYQTMLDPPKIVDPAIYQYAANALVALLNRPTHALNALQLLPLSPAEMEFLPTRSCMEYVKSMFPGMFGFNPQERAFLKQCLLTLLANDALCRQLCEKVFNYARTYNISTT